MDKNSISQHWENIYSEKLPEEVSWFQKKPTISLNLIQKFSNNSAHVIDVGGGASLLVDYLLKLGYS